MTEPTQLTPLTDDDNVRFHVVEEDEGDQPGTGLGDEDLLDFLHTTPEDAETLTASADTESLYANPNEGSSTVPWRIRKGAGCSDGKPYAVVKVSDGSVAGCHESHTKAAAQLRALYASESDASSDSEVLTVDDPGVIKISAEAYAGDRNLREYWTHGEGAVKIRWGTSGDFNRCVRHLSKYVRDPEGLCNEYHTEAVGKPPGKGHSGETESFAVRVGNAPVERVGTGDVTPPSRSVAWQGTLAVEGVETGDGREFAANSLTWPELPIPLMYQYETSHGGTTDKSTNVGNITEMWRDGNQIMGRGTIDLDDPYGMQAARKIYKKYLKGVSIDADSVKDADVELVFAQPDPNSSDEDILASLLTPQTPEKTIFHRGRVRGATMVNLPAFVEASLELIGDLSMLEDELMVATSRDTNYKVNVITAAASSGHRGYTIEIPELPPLEFFEEPTHLPPIGAVWIEPNGHIFGLVGPSGVAHRAFRSKRITIPMGNVDYTRWMNRPTPVLTPDGEVLKIRTGVITMNCGHLSPYASDDPEERMRHYDNSCSIAAVVRVGESRTHKAPWIAGSIMPMSTADFQRFQACQLSGDWAPHRERRGWKEFVAGLAVPVPGFARATDVAAVRVDDNAVVVASAVPIMLSEYTYDDVEIDVSDHRLELGQIRARLGSDHRLALANIKNRINGATKETKMGCAPCAAKRRNGGATSAQQPTTDTQVVGFGDGDSQQQTARSQAAAIANSRATSRG